MRRSLRRIAAVLAGLALVAALPAPCGCAPESASSRGADEHACCAPPTGVRAVDHGCCNEAPAAAPAVSAPVVPDAVAPSRTVLLVTATPWVHRLLPHRAATPTLSPPPTVLRV
jgi:hypothetical protein